MLLVGVAVEQERGRDEPQSFQLKTDKGGKSIAQTQIGFEGGTCTSSRTNCDRADCAVFNPRFESLIRPSYL